MLIDVNGDGFSLTNAAAGVNFDINADGEAHRISWTAANSDDSWLVLDRNLNDVIDNGTELFGNIAPQPMAPSGSSKNGFLALAEYDKPSKGGNADGVIDAHDSIFARLRLWRDANHNAVSENEELRTLPAVGLAVLDLRYAESKRTDEYGNRFRYRAKVEDAHGAQIGRWAWDIVLVTLP